MTQGALALVVGLSRPQQLATWDERPGIVVAADGGLSAVMARGWIPDRVVGDLDSAVPSEVIAARAAGAVVEQYPADKNESDLELAIAAAIDAGADTVHVVARDDGRLDHQIANLMVLAHPRWAKVEMMADIGEHRVWIARDRLTIELSVGDHLALLPVGGGLRVSTQGVAYPLDDEELSPFEARGIANEVVSTPVTVEVSSGVALVVSSPRQTSDHGAVPK